jgi:hypothetical protein
MRDVHSSLVETIGKHNTLDSFCECGEMTRADAKINGLGDSRRGVL